jgi:hypothetical protein
MKTENLFTIFRLKMEKIMIQRRLKFNIYDDDSMSDWIADEKNHEGFTLDEKTTIYTYNYMLNAIASTVDDIEFSLIIKPYEKEDFWETFNIERE